MQNLVKKLEEDLSGLVYHRRPDVRRFSRDQSIYYIQPSCVVLPVDARDMGKTVSIAHDAAVPITPRGGGSGTAGAALGEGIVVGFNRQGPMNRIIGLETVGNEPLVTAEAGVIHSRLQTFLRHEGLFLPADPSSAEMCMIGGNVATKASGPHALRHGSIDRYLKHLRFVTDRGELVDTADESTIPDRIKHGLADIQTMILKDSETVKRLAGRADRKIASGYNLFAFLGDRPPGKLVAQLLVGSVGTLGLVTSATLKAEPYIAGRATVVIAFENLDEAGDAVPHIRDLGVAAIEIISANTIRMVRSKQQQAFSLLDFKGHVLLVELEGPQRFDQIEGVRQVVARQGYHLESGPLIAEDDEAQARLWKDRKLILPMITHYRPNLKPLSVVNDVGVDHRRLAPFIREIEETFGRLGLDGAIYGHAGSGNLHLRPLFDVERSDLPSHIRQVADAVYEVVLKYDGTITAEHGMGRLRAPYLVREWGETIVGYMKQVKAVFDPDEIFNPGVIFSAAAITEHMSLAAPKGR